MTNEELLEWIYNGDEAALTKLCLMNTGLVKDRARLIARQYHCLRQTKYGGLSDYAKETLSELESVGKLALVECVRAGGMIPRKAGLLLTSLRFWTEPCGGIWNTAWEHYRLTGTAWEWCERLRTAIIKKGKV